MLQLVIAAALLAILAVIGVRLLLAYRAATGTPWQRFILVFRNSETILWARIQMVGGLLVTGGGGLVAFAQSPDVAGSMHVVIADAKQWAIYGLSLMGLGAVTEAVRRHRTQPDAVTGAVTAPPPAPKG